MITRVIHSSSISDTTGYMGDGALMGISRFRDRASERENSDTLHERRIIFKSARERVLDYSWNGVLVCYFQSLLCVNAWIKNLPRAFSIFTVSFASQLALKRQVRCPLIRNDKNR